jgi:hypothetical protein
MPSCILTLKKSRGFGDFDRALLLADFWSGCVNATRLYYGFNRDAGDVFRSVRFEFAQYCSCGFGHFGLAT